MKIDRSKSKKYQPKPPIDCKLFIDKIKSCDRKELHELLKAITTWHIGKCVLYDWIDVLDLFDSILEEACAKTGTWMLNCDKSENEELKFLVLDILHFTTLLIEHSYSRHLYNSIDYLIILLQSSDFYIVCGVLSLLYVFSKRSNFIPKLPIDKKQALIDRLIFLAQTWGGRENGFDLARCCTVQNPSEFPKHATNLHFAYTIPSTMIEIPNVHLAGPNASAVMETILNEHILSKDNEIKLFTSLRLAYTFPLFNQRLLCIQARLQALSILVYSAAIQETNNVLYDGLVEELVEVLNIQDPTLMDIKASTLKTLTSMIHLERTIKYSPYLQEIIKATQTNSYHGLLPALVRQCIDKLTDDNNERFPQSLSTALFSFLYHLASYEKGVDALVSCGIMQSLIKIVNYYDESQDFLTFVTRAVRVIDLIATSDMTSFQRNNGLQAFINRLEHEITQCRKEQPFIIRVSKHNQGTPPVKFDTHPPALTTIHSIKDMNPSEFLDENHDLTCYHQRAALIKSILNYLKKSFTEASMADTTRHIMDGSLPNSLKHIISNAEYYDPSLFHLSTNIVTSFIFQYPSQLSSLQDNGLTDVLMHAVLIKDIPAARDVIASLPNVFSALCLNTRGLENFMEYKPFDKLFRVLLLPEYLPTMKRRRETDPIYCTPSSLGNTIDELIRHQVILRTEAMKSIITLLEQLIRLGNNPKYSSSSTANIAGNDRNSSDDEYDDDETIQAAVPLLDYITNIMRFIEGVISNNTTDDHGKEFVKFGGLKLLLDILQMKNLPIDFPSSQACQCVVALCKSISTLLIKDNQFIEMILTNLDRILNSLTDFYSNRTYNSSLLVSSPTLHQLSIVHSHIALLCEIIQSEVHHMFIIFCSEEIGIRVLKNVNRLCLTLIWEKSILEINTIDQQRILSKLDRALGELYNLLVRQCSASQMIHGKDFYQQSAATKLVASTLAEVLRDGFSFHLPANNNLTENQIEKVRLTFFSGTLGFATSMLFDEHHHPYILMLQQFELSKAQHALFSAFEWTLDLIHRQSLTSQLNNPSPTEFLNSALLFILRLVNVKSILESPHSIPKNDQAERSYDVPLHYLALTHKHAFHVLTSSCSVLYDKSYLLKDHATEIIDSILSIFCHILRGELQQQENLSTLPTNEITQQQLLPLTADTGFSGLSTLMDFPPEHAIQDLLQRNNNLELVGDDCVSHRQAAITGQEVALSRDNNNTDKTITASSLNQILPESTQCHILTDYTSIFNFDVKRKYFRHELDRLKQNLRDEDLTIHVRCDNVLDDSFRELSQRSLQDWKHRFSIIFHDNEGQNPNDNLTIWYSMMVSSILDPNYGLFMKNSRDHLTYMPNPLSYSNKNHLAYFKFLGHIIGKSIFDKKYIDCHFTRPFYKYILDIPIDYTDMKSIDLEFNKKLVILLENDIEQLGLDLTFSLDVNEFGINKRIELIPNGSTVQVTNENKCEYIRVVCQEKIIGSIKQQMNSFLEGFYGIIPKCLISIFNEQELELFISGLPHINMGDLKTNE